MTDAELVDGALRGDESCFEQIMRANNERLFRVARSILRNDADAEDAVQQSYVAAFQALATFRQQARLSTWLTRIAVNVSLRKREQRRSTTSVDELSLASNQPTPEDAAMLSDVRRTLEQAIDKLDSQYRIVFVMREVQGLSTKEVGECLSISEETVRVRLHRARGMLRSTLPTSSFREAFGFGGERCDRIVAHVLERLSDHTLVRRVASGDRDALGALFDRHGAAVFAIATRQSSDLAAARVHQAFLELWCEAHTIHSHDCLQTWLAARVQ